jgi:hypothetical protein
MEGSDALDEAQVANHPEVGVAGARLRRLPVDWGAVRHRRSEVRERAIVSPQRA